MEIERKLREMGLELPTPGQPAGTYIGCVQSDNLLFVGGNIGRINGVMKYRGKVGAEVTIEQGYEMARNVCLNHLAVIKRHLGDLDRVERIVKVVCHVNSAPGFNQQPKVANGQSDLLVELWGDRGRHTRLALGAAELNDDIPVETEIIVQVRAQ